MKKLLLVPTIAMSLAFSPMTFAMHHDHGQNGSCQCGQMKHWMDGLDLSVAQKAKIKALKAKNKLQMAKLHAEMKSVKKQLHDLVISDKWSEEKLDDLVDKKAELLSQKMKAKYQMKHDLYEVLDTKQKKKFDEDW